MPEVQIYTFKKKNVEHQQMYIPVGCTVLT